MMVCAHGDVSAFCESRDMMICEQYSGDIEKYHGVCPVLVTSQKMSENEYYFLKGKLLARGVELVSTNHTDDKLMRGFLAYQVERRKKNYVGRQMFGFKIINGNLTLTPHGEAVTNRIFEMRDAGFTLRQIREDEKVHHVDGRLLSISTIQTIISNREKYIKKER